MIGITEDRERAIRAVVRQAIVSFADGFASKRIAEADHVDGVINRKIHNVFIASLSADIQYYSALSRSLDSSLGNMLERMAINIASMGYEVTQQVDGVIYQGQTDYIAELLERYQNTRGDNHIAPHISDYQGMGSRQLGAQHHKPHKSDYHLIDRVTGMHYLIELKIGGDLDTKKARSEKEALLEQYCILANSLGSEDAIKIFFATAYNKYGEGQPWKQHQVCQFFADDELLISHDFWNLICKSDNGYDIVLGEYRANAHVITEALARIKQVYMSE